MNKTVNTVPLLDLTPQLNQPLSPWNFLDYMRLLYWVFFSPQALRWYIRKFGKLEYNDITRSKTVEVLRHDPVQRQLVVQALVTLFITVPFVALGLSALGLSMNWTALAAGVALGLMSGGMVGTFWGITFGLAFGVSFGVVSSLFLGAIFGAAGSLKFSAAFGAALGAALGAAVGVALTAVSCINSDADYDVIKGVTGGMTFIMAGSLIFAVSLAMKLTAAGDFTAILVSNLKVIAFFSIGLGAAFCVSLSRLPDYIPLALAKDAFRTGTATRNIECLTNAPKGGQRST